MEALTTDRFTDSFAVEIRQYPAEMHRPASPKQHTEIDLRWSRDNAFIKHHSRFFSKRL